MFIFSDQLPDLTSSTKSPTPQSHQFAQRRTPSQATGFPVPQVAFMRQAKNVYLFFLGGHSMIALRLGLTLFFIVGICGCGSLTTSSFKGNNISFGSNVTPIGEIKTKQDKQSPVYIQGQVERRVPLVGRWVYQVSDSTGKIWIVTNQSKFKPGDQIVIKGKVNYQSIPLANQEFGEVYLEEQ